MRTIEEKKDTELFLHVWFSKTNFDADRRWWRNVECFWSHRSRKEGLDNAGWSGRSYIVLLVVFVLNVDDGWMNGLSMLATMFSRLDAPNCDLEIKILHLFDRMMQKTFFFLSSPMKPKRSSTILLSLSFSRESSMSECVKKNVESSLLWAGRSTVACRVDYLHRDVLDNDGWNGHHDQAHIFLEKRIVIFFFIFVFLSSRLSVIFFISHYSCTLFFIV